MKSSKKNHLDRLFNFIIDIYERTKGKKFRSTMEIMFGGTKNGVYYKKLQSYHGVSNTYSLPFLSDLGYLEAKQEKSKDGKNVGYLKYRWSANAPTIEDAMKIHKALYEHLAQLKKDKINQNQIILDFDEYKCEIINTNDNNMVELETLTDEELFNPEVTFQPNNHLIEILTYNDKLIKEETTTNETTDSEKLDELINLFKIHLKQQAELNDLFSLYFRPQSNYDKIFSKSNERSI